MEGKQKTKRLELRLSQEDHERLQTISEAYGLSLSGALRIAIRAMLRKVGLEHAKD